LLYGRVMTTRRRAGFATMFACAAVLVLLATNACTGGSESNAADGRTSSSSESPASPQVHAQDALADIHRAIPIYQGAEFREDLTRTDQVTIRNRYGPGAAVYTLASDDSFPQVYHYYTTYLSQFRAYPAPSPLPSSQQNWRTLEVQLNQAMQDPFIPGEALDLNGRQVTLQIAETETEPKTVIRYIVTPRPAVTAPPMATASAGAETAPVTR
jgi:hypothetical protein